MESLTYYELVYTHHDYVSWDEDGYNYNMQKDVLYSAPDENTVLAVARKFGLEIHRKDDVGIALYVPGKTIRGGDGWFSIKKVNIDMGKFNEKLFKEDLALYTGEEEDK